MKQFCETSFKNRKLSAELTASYECVLRFYDAIFLKYAKKLRSAAPVMQNHLSKLERMMFERAPHLRKSAPWPRNMSYGDVSCTAPAIRYASWHILFKRPMFALVFETAAKPIWFAFDKVQNPLPLPGKAASRPQKVLGNCQFLLLLILTRAWLHSCVRFVNLSNTKSAPTVWRFEHLEFETRSAPQPRALRNVSVSRSVPTLCVCTVLTSNLLRATAACNFWISQLPKVLRNGGVS